jgi:hypothetical protein
VETFQVLAEGKVYVTYDRDRGDQGIAGCPPVV